MNTDTYHIAILMLASKVVMCIAMYIPKITTVMVVLSFPIGLVTVHVYVPLSLVVTLSMEKSAQNTALVLV